ncbi:glycosyltransferase [Pistricoccus aurantiacus]|uniref:Glycosyltransferase n=1 Tax=Pistricoccus aurantiacus TaxID=1883414 RepID=A0A5B8SYN4_9GAMM|nr:TIGR04283 family arsenosugar biosynthesis glycosyltransferase [Pistricoccus aurantiacus]QEA40635.1 glycosyltransferase [Pistricoccus aurantiacus]
MTLSIIIPALDEAAGIEAQLVSLQPLRERGAELLLVDGGSRDATRQLAAPYVTRCLRSNPGRAAQMNLGTAHARGAQLLFLHADTRLPEDADRLIANALESGRCWGRFAVRLEGRHPMIRVIAWAMNLRSRLTGIATGDQALFMTRDAFDRVGGFPEQPLMEDIEISRRLKRLSSPACLKAQVISSGRRWELHGIFSTILLMWRLRYRYWRGEDCHQLAKEYRHAR